MQRKNPRQHKHNWQMRFTEWNYTEEVPDPLKPYSYYGFNARRYWACIRGKKIKHTKFAPDYYVSDGGWSFKMEERVFIPASGVAYSEQKVIA